MQSKHTDIYTPTSVATLNSSINNQDNNKILAFTSTPYSIPEIKKKRRVYRRASCSVPISISALTGLENEQPEGDLKKASVRAGFIPLVNQNAIENQRKYTELLDGKV